MYSLMFLGFAIAQVLLFVWLWKIARRTDFKAAYMLLVPQFFLIWDNLRVAGGIVIGFGDLLQALTWPAFWAHWLSGCWLIIASGSLLRLAGVPWAQPKWVMGSFCLLATALMLHDIPLFWTQQLYPACEFDLIRYSGQVSEATRCFADQELVKSGPPIAPIVTCYVVIVSGIVFWRKTGWPWLSIGGIVMLLTALVPALNRHRLDNLGEVFIVGGAIVSFWLLSRASADQAPTNLQSQDQPSLRDLPAN